MCDWFTLLYAWNSHNFVSQQYSNKSFFLKKREKSKESDRFPAYNVPLSCLLVAKKCIYLIHWENFPFYNPILNLIVR